MSLAPSSPLGQLSALTFSPEMSLEGAEGVQGGGLGESTGHRGIGSAGGLPLSLSPLDSSQRPPPR